MSNILQINQKRLKNRIVPCVSIPVPVTVSTLNLTLEMLTETIIQQNIQDEIISIKSEFKSRKGHDSRKSQSIETLDSVKTSVSLLNSKNELNSLIDESTNDKREYEMQQQLTAELASRAELLKNNTLMFRDILASDAKILQETEQSLENNFYKLQKENQKITKLSKESWSTTIMIWSSLAVKSKDCFSRIIEMEDWENEDSAVAVAAVPGKWDDEDNDDDVKDSWDCESDNEDSPVPSPTSASQPEIPKKKKTLAQKIAERKTLEEIKKQEFMISQQQKLALEQESEQDKKARLLKEMQESDLENTKELFSGINLTSDTGTLSLLIYTSAKNSPFDDSDPKTRDEFDNFRDIITSKCSNMGSRLQYPYFIETLIRDLIVPLEVDDIRKISSTITAMMNEKQKAQKEASKKGKKSAKKSIKTMPDGERDTTDYGDVYDEFDDFM